MGHFIAIDPGSKKCGLVLVDVDQGIVLEGRVLKSSLVVNLINRWKREMLVEGILLGNGTTSLNWQKLLEGISSVEIVEERGTTLLARQRYWEIWPPTGWRQLLPEGLILPPDELDAVAALLLIESHFKKRFSWQGTPNFKISP